MLTPITRLTLPLLSMLIVIVSNAQTEIVRKPLKFHENLLQVNGLADESGFVLIDLQFAGGVHVFKFVNKDLGEISSYTEKIVFDDENLFGFTSNDKEFTIYLRGYARNKTDYYTITFYKEPRRLPILNPWDVGVYDPDKNAIKYNRDGKFFYLKRVKSNFVLTEVTDIGKAKSYTFSATAAPDNLDNTFTYWPVDEHPDYATYRRRRQGRVPGVYVNKIYPRADTLIVSMEDWDEESKTSNTKLVFFDLTRKKVDIQEIASELRKSACSSLVLRDRLYRLENGRDTTSFQVFEFPTLKNLKTYTYARNQRITIKTSRILNRRKKSKEPTKSPVRTEEQVVNLFADGTPYMSVRLADGNALLRLGSFVVKGGYNNTQWSEDFYEFDACLSPTLEPCDKTFVPGIHEIIEEKAEVMEDNNEADWSVQVENRRSVYSVHINRRTKEYFVLEYIK